jgi:hypothetical protein
MTFDVCKFHPLHFNNFNLERSDVIEYYTLKNMKGVYYKKIIKFQTKIVFSDISFIQNNASNVQRTYQTAKRSLFFFAAADCNKYSRQIRLRQHCHFLLMPLLVCILQRPGLPGALDPW